MTDLNNDELLEVNGEILTNQEYIIAKETDLYFYNNFGKYVDLFGFLFPIDSYSDSKYFINNSELLFNEIYKRNQDKEKIVETAKKTFAEKINYYKNNDFHLNNLNDNENENLKKYSQKISNLLEIYKYNYEHLYNDLMAIKEYFFNISIPRLKIEKNNYKITIEMMLNIIENIDKEEIVNDFIEKYGYQRKKRKIIKYFITKSNINWYNILFDKISINTYLTKNEKEINNKIKFQLNQIWEEKRKEKYKGYFTAISLVVIYFVIKSFISFINILTNH